MHLFERKWRDASTIPAPELGRQLLDMFTRYGFTSVFYTGSMWNDTRQLRDRIESGDVPGPHIHSTGEALLAPGAMPSERILGLLGFMTFPAPEIKDDADAAAAARGLLAQGIDGIKVHLEPPPVSCGRESKPVGPFSSAPTSVPSTTIPSTSIR